LWIRNFFCGFSTRLPRPSSSSRLHSFLSMLRCTIPEMRLFKIASGDFVRVRIEDSVQHCHSLMEAKAIILTLCSSH
jgi:hypothetical protein